VKVLPKASLVVALALCALPVLSPAVEAPAASAPSQEETNKKLADAQQRLAVAVREVAELSGQLGRRFALRETFEPGDGRPPRALLGVAVGQAEGQGGARVLDVSPGGAAAEAGMKSGDVITSVAGEDLTKDSDPGRALVEKMRQLEPGLKVQVGVLRDGKKMSFDVMPRPAPGMRTEGRGPMGGGMPAMPLPPGARGFTPPTPAPGMRPSDGRMTIREFNAFREDALGTRFHGMEFATLSERLGSYFGVKSGVLVVRAGVNSPFKLQDGDVLLAIDGREASSALHAGRILRSYQPGEKLTLRVQRDHKAQNLEVTAPGRGRGDD
jgi:S1-C subfamily serine protease